MARPKLELTDDERRERLKEQRRKNSLAYYYRKHPPARASLETADDMRAYINKRKEYCREYYQLHKEEIKQKTKDWKLKQNEA
jgi:hypothetical protein